MVSSSLTIFFRLLNFGVLAGIGAFIFQKYFKNSIDEKITQKEMLIKGLEEQELFLRGKSANLEKKLQKQENHASLLKEKIDEWTLKVRLENVKKHGEYHRYMDHAVARVVSKNKEIAKRQATRQKITDALDEVNNFFAQETNKMWAQTYLDKLITGLERK